MLSIGQDTQIYIRRVATDMRNSFDGLSALAHALVGHDPGIRQYFVFLNKRRTIVKILCWEGDGWAVFSKRLESGTFNPPMRREDGSCSIDRAELTLMMDGVDAVRLKQRKRYQERA